MTKLRNQETAPNVAVGCETSTGWFLTYRLASMAATLAVVVGASGCSSAVSPAAAAPATPSPAVPVDPANIVFRLCDSPRDDASESASWNQTWRPAFQAALADVLAVYPDWMKGITVRRDQSEECFELARTACGGDPGLVYCREDLLGRMLHAVALLSSSFAIQYDEPADDLDAIPLSFEQAHAEAQASAIGLRIQDRAGDSTPPNSWVKNFIASAELAEHVVPRSALYPQNPRRVYFGGVSYAVASNLFMAFLLGHEIAHAHDACHIAEASLEQDGTFMAAVAIQKKGPVCAPVSADELGADRCGFRALERMNGLITERDRQLALEFEQLGADPAAKVTAPGTSLDYPIAVGRAIALIAFSNYMRVGLARGWTISDIFNGASADYQELNRLDYLREFLRVHLFADVLLRKEESYPEMIRLCGGSALSLVADAETAVGECTTGRQVQPQVWKDLAKALERTVASNVLEPWRKGDDWSELDEQQARAIAACGAARP
jgi:hypothetical protein